MKKNEDRVISVYSAGPLFTQHDLTVNVLMKRAIWERSHGKFKLLLPQSKEKRESGEQDIATFIRNSDLLQVVQCDLVLARFDGVELDPGTVVEFMLAKFLGKGALIVRSDSRRQGSDLIDEPYNLMVKNWPRTVEMQIDALTRNYHHFQKWQGELTGDVSIERELDLEQQIVESGIYHLADEIITGLEQVLQLPSPYPEKYQQEVYQQVRFMLGKDFEKMLTEENVRATISTLSSKGVL